MAGWLSRLFGVEGEQKAGESAPAASVAPAPASTPRGRWEESDVDEIVITGNGTFEQEIVGESHYQDALERICGGRTEDGAHFETSALLVYEDDNPYDNQAVAVVISGAKVGHLSRPVARAFRAQLAAANAPRGWPIRCKALIVGGWLRDGDDGEDRGHFGVKLDFNES